MAGILFTNKNYALAGYNSRKERITGIGGKKQGFELPYETALRESIEEIFELEFLTSSMLRQLSEKVTFDTCFSNGEYTTFIMSFDDLEVLIRTVCQFNVKSIVYDSIPQTINELILFRKPNPNAELKWLMLVPLERTMKFSSSLLFDIETFNSM
jgi:hypothetical protein